MVVLIFCFPNFIDMMRHSMEDDDTAVNDDNYSFAYKNYFSEY